MTIAIVATRYMRKRILKKKRPVCQGYEQLVSYAKQSKYCNRKFPLSTQRLQVWCIIQRVIALILRNGEMDVNS